MYFDVKFNEIYPVSIASGNGLAQYRGQAITRINDGLMDWGTQAPQGLSELNIL